ncbi:MAG: hypothetical protein ACRDBX_06225, partial [Erysipelotrichaceae bacterium]
MKKRWFLMCMVVGLLFTSFRVQSNGLSDVTLKWIADNTTFYLGASMEVEAFVNGSATDAIEWSIQTLGGTNTVVNLAPMGYKAQLLAKQPGRVELAAKTKDGSDAMRFMVLNVEAYPNDAAALRLVGDHIVPIQSRTLDNGAKWLQVEVNRALSANSAVAAMQAYLAKLATLGPVSGKAQSLYHERYAFYTLTIGNQALALEVKVDKQHGAYSTLHQLLTQTNVSVPKPSTPSPSEPRPTTPIAPTTPSITTPSTSYEPPLTSIEGSGSKEDPFVVEANKGFTSQEKINALGLYLDLLKQEHRLQVVSTLDETDAKTYVVKLVHQMSKNDFYVEIIVDKQDEAAYEPMIQMLNQLD